VQPNNTNMAEPINLDELLNKAEEVANEVDADSSADAQENNIDSSEAENTASSEENSQEDGGSQEENVGTEEEDEEVYINTSSDDKTGLEAQTEISESDNEANDSKSEKQTEYKFKDEFIKKAVEYYEKYQTLQPFLEATQVDYDAVDDVELLRIKFNKENSDLPTKTQERIFQKELEKYNLDSYEDDDVEMGQALLKRDANKLRQNFKEEQQLFLKSIEPAGQEQDNTEVIAQMEAQRAENKSIAKSGVESVLKNNYIKVGANGEGINFQVGNVDKVVDYALDSTQFLSTFAKQDGSVDWDKWVKVVSFTENPDLFIGELIKHGKSLGRKAMESELKNFKPNVNSKAVIQGDDANSSPFDNKLDFLKQMVVTKK
jgi:hypothetical protein